MSVPYDKYYETENLFGNPYPALVDFYSKLPRRGKLLDLGCGQGRDAIALAKLGYEVVGIDHSAVGIAQLNEIARKEKLPLKGLVFDIYDYADFEAFDFILLDSMFHFAKKDRDKEAQFLKKVFTHSKANTLITICIQDTGEKIAILNSIIAETDHLELIDRSAFIYIFENEASRHRSETKYEMITIKKLFECNPSILL